MISRFSKYQVATAIAILFHSIGIIGILFYNAAFFIRCTPFNLLLMFVLLYWTQEAKNKYFLFFLILCFCIGVGVEIIGVRTAIIFGNYQYGEVLGYKIANVPLVIGINWIIIIYCCGITMHTILMKAIKRIALDSGAKPLRLKTLSVIVDGATLAVFFDWIMEPVAVKLGYWHWIFTGEVPFYNYFCWFGVSVFLLSLFQILPFSFHV